MNAGPFLRAVVEAVHDARLDAILVGNAGAAVLGAPVTTEDFDFVIRRTSRNIEKLREIAEALDAELFRPFYPISNMIRLERDDGLQVDFLTRIHGIRSFEGLKSRAGVVDFGGWSVRVAHLKDIIKSKRAAGRPKDMAVLPTLEAVQREREAQGYK